MNVPPSSCPHRLLFRAAVVCLVWTLGFSLLGCHPQSGPPPAPPPPEVTVETIQPRRVAVTTELPGRIDAVRVAQIRARVAGILLKRLFVEGADVQAGEKLFEIDPAPFQATYNSAKANVDKAEANRKQAQALVDRYKNLVEVEAVSKQDYDNAVAGAQQADAEVEVAKAALSTASLNLGYASVTAPISGRIGRALVTEGALVGQNESTPLATIQQLDPVYFDFTQSTTEMLRLRRLVDTGAVKNIEPGAARITLILEDGSAYPQPGKLLFSDISVDESTGTVTLRAEFPNPNRMLLPGMFARGRLEQAVDEQALTAPQRAVTRGPNGSATALIVTPDNKVEVRSLTLGDATGDAWVVVKGVQAGDRVITEGLQKARPGATVKPVAPAPPPGPSPVNPAPNPPDAAKK